VTDHRGRADTVREPEAGLQHVALDVVGGQVHQVHLERGVDGVGQVRLQKQVADRSQPLRVEASTEDHPQMVRPDLHEIRSGDLQGFEIIGEIGDVLQIQTRQVDAHAAKSHTVLSSPGGRTQDAAQYTVGDRRLSKASVNSR
jgi:hypothetical protein